jgi:hypothetical protein
MKKHSLFAVFVALLCTIALQANDVVLHDFESSNPAVGVKYGAAFEMVANPLPGGLNTTANVGKISRTSANWYELIYFPVSFEVPANTKKYVHMLVKFPAQPDIAIRYDATSAGGDGSADIRSTNKYTALGEWQGLVFEVSGGTTGRNVIQLNILADMGWNNSPSGFVLNATDKFGYIDQIVVNDNPLPLGTTYFTGNSVFDFEPATAGNITGVVTHAHGDNTVTYPVANPDKTGINITENAGKRVATAGANWWTGMEFTMNSPILVDDQHNYLHIMMMVPEDGQRVVFDVRQGATKVISDRVVTIPTANVWHDVVIDVNNIVYISGIAIKAGHWDGTAVGDYYFDEIWIDDNANPRVNPGTSIENLSGSLTIRMLNNTIHFEDAENQNSTITIFNSVGSKIHSFTLANQKQLELPGSGLYIIQSSDFTRKVLVP